jgi:hypothetical protein
MKCSVKGCEESALFVFIDAYFHGNSIHRSEMNMYLFCLNHDTQWHNSKLERSIPLKLNYRRTLSLRKKLSVKSITKH